MQQPDSTPVPTLADVLAQAEDQPAATLAMLMDRAPTLPADADGTRALRLAEHVALGHLGDASTLAAQRRWAEAAALLAADATAAQALGIGEAAQADAASANNVAADLQAWCADVLASVHARRHDGPTTTKPARGPASLPD